MAATQSFKKLTMIVLVLFLLLSTLPVQAFAAEEPSEWTVQFDGGYNGKFSLTSNDVNIFRLDKIVPGGVYPGKLHVKNNTRYRIEFAFLSIVSTLDDQTLYDALDLKISEGTNIIYEGSYGDTQEPISTFYSIPRGETKTFDVVVSLDKDYGNDLMNKKMESVWSFESRCYGSHGGGSSPDEKEEEKVDPGANPETGGVLPIVTPTPGTESIKPTPGHDDSSTCSYIIDYVDADGKELMPSEQRIVPYGEEVTFSAKEIDGYTPEDVDMSLIAGSGDNEITFVYQPVHEEFCIWFYVAVFFACLDLILIIILLTRKSKKEEKDRYED